MSAKWRILLLDTKPGNVNHYILLGIEAALKQDDRVESVHFAGYADALNSAIENGCNFFLAFDGENLDRGICRRLASVCGTSVLWLTDDPYVRDPVNLANADLFDFVFTNDSASVPYYKGKARHLPFAANPRFNFQTIPERDENHYLYDVLFVGTAWPNRVRFLKELIKNLNGLKFKLALPGNDQIPIPDLDLAPSSYQWRIPNSEMCRLANRSRIVLTLHRDFGRQTETAAAATPGPRLFEVALAGGFQIVDLSLPETCDYFNVGQEVAGFSTASECREQIVQFIANPEKRLRMARAAQQRCLAEHLYEHRIRGILDIVTAVVLSHTRPEITHKPDAQAKESPSLARQACEALPTARSLDQRAVSPAKKKSRILMVAHNSIRQPPFGGVEVYVDLLARSLREEFETFVYYPDNSRGWGAEVVCEDLESGATTRHSFETPLSYKDTGNLERESYFARLIHDRRIDLVHFHHLMFHPWTLPLVARTMGIPAVLSVADHYPVCESFTLLDAAGRYCDIPERPPTTCDLCLNKLRGTAGGSQASRRALVGSVLDNLDLLIFGTECTRDILFSQFPSLKRSGRAWMEGVPLDDRKPLLRLRVKGAKLKAVVVGNFSLHKGGDVFCEIFDAMRGDPIEFHLYGAILPPYREILRDKAYPNVTIHGSYQPETLRDSLRDVDVGLFLSIWPETYVLTLSEAWRAGVVPIASDLGAMGERIEHGVNGLKIPVNAPGSAVHTLRGLMADREELERLRSNINSGLYCQLEEHVRLLSEKYEQLLQKYRVSSRADVFYADPPLPRLASADNVFRARTTWFIEAGGSRDAKSTNWQSSLALFRVLRFWRKRGTMATLGRLIQIRFEVSRRAVRIPQAVLKHAHHHGIGATLRRCARKLFARVR